MISELGSSALPMQHAFSCFGPDCSVGVWLEPQAPPLKGNLLISAVEPLWSGYMTEAFLRVVVGGSLGTGTGHSLLYGTPFGNRSEQSVTTDICEHIHHKWAAIISIYLSFYSSRCVCVCVIQPTINPSIYPSIDPPDLISLSKSYCPSVAPGKCYCKKKQRKSVNKNPSHGKAVRWNFFQSLLWWSCSSLLKMNCTNCTDCYSFTNH